ncbi:PREDICTED: importin subunit alpha-1-like [Cyphomyrmex costatus]|uniref:importin subunit alpha-1-like n=1 Tax=Cyphomyrmex costatus TaxID=456900 RepID=UPI0008523EE9|nr:PREDICTED: importin subunit alpha-1-like [Cyphomyrmex costatus]
MSAYTDCRLRTNFEDETKLEELIRNRKNAVELCKAIREDRLLKHNLGTKQEENIDRETYKKLTYKAAISPPLCVDEIVNYINSSEETLQLRAIQSYERLGEEKNSVNDMIKGGIISRCIELLDSNKQKFYNFKGDRDDTVDLTLGVFIKVRAKTPDTCRILSYLTDGSKSNVQAIMETGILPKLLECLTSEKKGIFFPTLLTIRNIVEFGDDAYKDDVITAGGLPCLRSVLSLHCDKEDVTEKETIWIICKMAGNMDQIQSIIDAGLLKILINRIAYGNAQAMAAWAVSTMIIGGTDQQFIQIVNNNVLLAYCALLHSDDCYNILCALTGLTKVLLAAKNEEQKEIFVTMLKKARGFEKIEALQYHKDEQLYKQSVTIMKLCSPQKLFTFEGDDQSLGSNIQTVQERSVLSIDTVTSISAFLIDERVQEIIQDLNSTDETLQFQALQIYRDLLFRPEINSSILDTVLPFCFKHLDSDDSRLQVEVMSLLAALIKITPLKMQYIVKHEAIQKLVKLFQSTSFVIMEHAIFITTKIIKDCPYARDLALQNNALPILINLIKPGTYENKEIKMLSGLVLMNMLSSGTSQQLTELLNAGVLIEFCNLLKTEDYDIVINALKGFSKILHNAKEKGQIERFATMIEEAGGLNRLVALRCHQNEMIYKKSTSIIHLYYFLIN